MKIVVAPKKPQINAALRVLLKNLLKLSIAGVFIGMFHAHDGWVAALLAVYMVLTVGKKYRNRNEDRHIYLVGLTLSAILGVICELWGIYFGHWTYHDLPSSREFPRWLPFAWGLAFTYLYKLERELILLLTIHRTQDKLLLATVAAMIFPTIGEMITINLGVWTYAWALQILGVPLLAIFLLMVFHTGVNWLMGVICRKLNWHNPVFYAAAETPSVNKQ